MYAVVLLTEKNEPIMDFPGGCDTKKEAIDRAKYMLSDDWASRGEITHSNLGTFKVEVRNSESVCVWDKFYV